MDSKITGVDGVQIASVGAGQALKRPNDAVSAEAQAASEGNSNAVQITGTARTLASLETAMREVPIVNEAHVAQLRSAIEQGTYAVRPEHIADQLMLMERALARLQGPEK